MDNKKQFFQLLKPVRRKLLMKLIFQEFHYWILAASVLSVLVLIAARLFVIPFYEKMAIYGCFFLLPFFAFRIVKNKPRWKEAAEIFNRYIPEDRVITALALIKEDGMLQQLQLAEAITFMKKEQSRVLARIKRFLLPKWLFITAAFVSLSAILYYFPNQTQLLAVKKETEIALMKKVEKKVEEKAKKEKNTETKRAFEKAQKILTKNPDPKKALLALEKEKNELKLQALKQLEKLENLKSLQQEIKNVNLSKLAAALETKDVEKINKELEQLTRKYDSLTNSQKDALGKLTGTDKKLSEKEIADLAKQLAEALNAENTIKELADAETALGEAADSLKNEMLANGFDSKQVALNSANQSPEDKTASQTGKNVNPSTGSQGSSQGKQSVGNSSQGTGNGSQGNGTGAGNGKGTGAGQGSSSGNGGGSGAVSGSSAGLGAGSRQLLTVPEKLGGKNNLQKDSGSIGKGSPTEQYTGNGPVVKGKLRSYQEVYQKYTDAYRNSTDRVKLPSDLEEIVKNYYLLLDPNKE